MVIDNNNKEEGGGGASYCFSMQLVLSTIDNVLADVVCILKHSVITKVGRDLFLVFIAQSNVKNILRVFCCL